MAGSQAQVETEVLAAANHLVEVFGRHDVTAYFAAFSEDATFVFYNHPERLESRQAWEQLWQQWEGEGFGVLACRSTNQLVQVLTEDVAVFNHSVETEAEFGGEAATTFERETIVFHRVGERWLAVHEHLSPMPEA